MPSSWKKDELADVLLAGHHLIRFDSVLNYMLSSARIVHNVGYCEYANWPEASKHMQYMAVLHVNGHQTIAFLCRTPSDTVAMYDAPPRMWYSFGLDIDHTAKDPAHAGSYRNHLARKLKKYAPQAASMLRKTHFKTFSVPDVSQSTALVEGFNFMMETDQHNYNYRMRRAAKHREFRPMNIEHTLKINDARKTILKDIAREITPTYNELLRPWKDWNINRLNQIKYVGRVPAMVAAKMRKLEFKKNSDPNHELCYWEIHWSNAKSISEDPTYNKAYSNCADLARELANVPCSVFGLRFLPSHPEKCKFDRAKMPPDFSFLSDLYEDDDGNDSSDDERDVFLEAAPLLPASVRLMDGFAGCLHHTDGSQDLYTSIRSATSIKLLVCTVRPSRTSGWRAMALLAIQLPTGRECCSFGNVGATLVAPAPETDKMANLGAQDMHCVAYGDVTGMRHALSEALLAASLARPQPARLRLPATRSASVRALHAAAAQASAGALLNVLDTDFGELADDLGFGLTEG